MLQSKLCLGFLRRALSLKGSFLDCILLSAFSPVSHYFHAPGLSVAQATPHYVSVFVTDLCQKT